MINRNKRLREKYIQVSEENGLKFRWISAKLNISNSTLSHWKNSNFDMAKPKLDVIEEFLNGYDK